MTEMRKSLKEIVEQLPSEYRPAVDADRMDRAIGVGATMPDLYVWPDLMIERGVDVGSILLIKAPAAMGKSEAARAIAHLADCMYIDLTDVKIGTGTLTGMLSQIVSYSDYATLMNGLMNGRVTLLLDSLDEAALSAGQDHFWAFLEDVCGIMKSASKSRQMVILGRPESIDSAAYVIRENGVPIEVAELAHLTQSQSNDLIDMLLDRERERDGRASIHRIHRGPFEALRDDVLGVIGSALAADQSERENFASVSVDYFTGYPPVVQAIARRLDVDNPGASTVDSASRQAVLHGEEGWGTVLRDICESILDRESQKVRMKVKDFSSPAMSERELATVFTREEQILRILRSFGSDIRNIPPQGLSSSVKSRYEDAVGTFVADHPFVRGEVFASQVFSDYARAVVAVSTMIEAMGADDQARVLERFKPGPFFSYLCNAMLAGEDPTISDRIVDDLLISHKAGSSGRSEFSLSGREGVLSLHLFDSNDRGGRRELKFNVDSPSGVIELSSPLASGSIVIPDGGLIVRSPKASAIELGPELLVLVQDLELSADRISVNGVDAQNADGPGKHGALIIANELSSAPNVKLSVFPDPSSLAVLGSVSHYPWNGYARRRLRVASPAISEVAHQAFFFIRKVLSSMKKGANGPSQHAELVDFLIVGKNQIFSATCDSLVELGVLARRGDRYELEARRLAEFGISYTDVRKTDILVYQPLIDAVLASASFAPVLDGGGRQDR